jgi:tetratricopeptide (TPR) repeat protein
MQAHNYPGAETVLGWSFYSQGTTERATSAEEFLNWALEKLGITLAATSASAKADAIAETMMRRRVLLVLDGVEPLQHGPGPQLGQLKDLGLRALLRRFAATPPGAAQGQVVLTSRLAVKDISRWQDTAAHVIDVERLSNKAGAALLHDNGVRGADKELENASHEFGGHPLALGLLASLLKETQNGDVRRRDHIRGLTNDTENPGHDHVKRVMESYEKEWLAGRPLLLTIMQVVGLFDRPASRDCLNALQATPAIDGLTNQIVKVNDDEWQRAITRLREVRLLAPPDAVAPDALDAHPLVREWFGERLLQLNEAAWRAAHGRLYEHLRSTTREGERPTLQELAPLYQAMIHACRAGRYEESLRAIFDKRLSRRMPTGEVEGYSSHQLGAHGSNLAGLNGYFERAYDTPRSALSLSAQGFLFSAASFALRPLGRFGEALIALEAGLKLDIAAGDWVDSARASGSIAQVKLVLGDIENALHYAKNATSYARRGKDIDTQLSCVAILADVLHQAGRRRDAKQKFHQSEKLQQRLVPLEFLGRVSGYHFCDLLMQSNLWEEAQKRAKYCIEISNDHFWTMTAGLEKLVIARTSCYFSVSYAKSHLYRKNLYRKNHFVTEIHNDLNASVQLLRTADSNEYIPRGYLARSAFYRNIGDWSGSSRDLDEVEEIARPEQMQLYLCDMALAGVRLAFARTEAFAPLHGLIDNVPPEPEVPNEAATKLLREEATRQLAIAADYIEKCGYHRRDEELAELQAVLRGERTFASLPPRV